MGSSQSAVRCVTELSLARGQLSAHCSAKRREESELWRQLLTLTSSGAPRPRAAALAHRMAQASDQAEQLEAMLGLLDPLLRAAKSVLQSSGSKQPRFATAVAQSFAVAVKSIHEQNWLAAQSALASATDAMVKSGAMPPTLLRPDTDAGVARILNMAEEHVVSAQLQTMPVAPRSTAADLRPVHYQT